MGVLVLRMPLVWRGLMSHTCKLSPMDEGPGKTRSQRVDLRVPSMVTPVQCLLGSRVGDTRRGPATTRWLLAHAPGVRHVFIPPLEKPPAWL